MVHKPSFKMISLSLLLLLLQNSASAAVVNFATELPGSALPSSVSNALTSQQPPPKRGRVGIISPEETKKVALSEQAKKIRFVLNKVNLEGNTVYSEAMLRRLYQNKIHKKISVEDLFNIAIDITNFYRNTGYILSRAILPPQHVKNGVVTIKVIEGYISSVEVTGHPRGAKCIIQAYGNKIKECPPLKLSRMERYLLLANETPGTQVKAVLAASKASVGGADLSLVTDNKPVTGYLSYDNYGTRYIGPQQMTASMNFNSFVSSGDTTQFTVTKTPKGGELTFIDINYNLPINDEGDRFNIGGTRAHTHPLFVLQPVQIDGLNNNYYTGFQFPLIRSRAQSLTLQTEFNWLDSEVTTFDQQLYNDHIRSIDIGASYNYSDSWSGINYWNGDFRQGLPFLGYTSNTNTNPPAPTSRPGGRGDYTKFSAQYARLQVIKGPFYFYGLVRGQWAFNPLLASEQFTFGGSQIGRGYDVAEILGDKGVAGTVELRFDWNVEKFLISTIEFYTFYDFGKVWDFKHLIGQPASISGTSTGLGARFAMTKYISGNLMWTQTLTKPVEAEQFIGDGRRPRVFFSVVASFG